MTKHYPKKIKLGVHGRRTKWTPVWTVLKKYGAGKKIHPSRMTRLRRNWRQNKLRIKPRRIHKRFVG